MKNGIGTGLAGWIVSISILIVSNIHAQSAMIKGRVYNAHTFEEVSHVNILVRDTEGAIITSITTGSNGRYHTDSLEPGHYRIEIRSRYFETAIVNNMVLQVARAAILDVALTPVTDEKPASETQPQHDKPSNELFEILGGVLKNVALGGL